MLAIRRSLVEQIQNAFRGVTLDGGIGLLEALEIDSHAPENEIACARKGDESLDWRKLSAQKLKGAFASLAHFDAKGMRFHLPAFLAAELSGELDEELLWYLCQVKGWAGERFSLLNSEQRHIVCEILRFLADQPRYSGQIVMLKNAIQEFWARD